MQHHMQHQEFAPPEALRDAVQCFWYTSRDFGAQPSTFEVLPDGYAEIVFHFSSACGISYQGSWQPLSSPFLVGLLDRPVLLRAQNRLEIVGIRCFPWTVFELLGLPAGKDGGRIAEHPIARLHAPLRKLVEAGRPADALAEATRYFLQARSRLAPTGCSPRRAGPCGPPTAPCRWARWRRPTPRCAPWNASSSRRRATR